MTHAMDEAEIHISRSPHRPVHWYADREYYWITAATLDHWPHFRPDSRKQHFIAEMLEAAERWSVTLVGWTLMEHHYHAILQPEKGPGLVRFLNRLHTRTSALVNREDRRPGRQVWRQYWDTLLRTEGDFWSRMNYMWWNPVRHGFCRTPEEWEWTNLHPVMADADETTRARLARFPAPRRLPGDAW